MMKDSFLDIEKSFTLPYVRDMMLGDIVTPTGALFDDGGEEKMSILDLSESRVSFRRDLGSPSVQYFSKFFDQKSSERVVMTL